MSREYWESACQGATDRALLGTITNTWGAVVVSREWPNFNRDSFALATKLRYLHLTSMSLSDHIICGMRCGERLDVPKMAALGQLRSRSGLEALRMVDGAHVLWLLHGRGFLRGVVSVSFLLSKIRLWPQRGGFV